MKLNFQWKQKTGQFQQGDSLYVNRIRLGGYDWNSTRSQSEDNKALNWVGGLELPSLSDKSKRLYGSTPDEMKAKMERVVTGWFEEALREEAAK